MGIAVFEPGCGPAFEFSGYLQACKDPAVHIFGRFAFRRKQNGIDLFTIVHHDLCMQRTGIQDQNKEYEVKGSQ